MFEILKRKVPIPGAIRLAMLVFGLFGVGFGTSSHAQEVPSTVDPGQIERDLRGSREPIRVQPTNPEFGITQEVPDVPEGAESISFVLEQISFTGDKSVYSDEELLGDFKSRIGQEVTVAELFEAAAQMSARYRNSGYLLSSVIVPAQEIDSGAVIFQVIEGYVDQLMLDSERVSEKYPEVVRRYLDKILLEKPLTRLTLERYLLLANDLPGISVSSFIQPSSTSVGAATLTVKLAPVASQPLVRLDNRGTKFVGPYQLEVSGSSDALKLGDSRLDARVITAPGEGRELNYASIGYMQEQDAEGTAIEVGLNAMRAEPGEELRNLALKLEAYGVSVSARSKIIRSRATNLTLATSFSWNNSETRALDALLFKDSARTLNVSADFSMVDRFSGVNTLIAGVSKGLSAFGATAAFDPLASKSDAEPDATWLNLTGVRYQNLGPWLPRASAVATVSMQYSFDPLSSSREFGVGGRANGSAFDPAEITGDHGLSGRLEFRYDMSVPNDVPINQNKYIKINSMQPYSFVDGGAVWHDEGEATGQQHDRISSAGLGARFSFSRGFSGSIEVAKPYGKTIASEGDREPRIFVELSALF